MPNRRAALVVVALSLGFAGLTFAAPEAPGSRPRVPGPVTSANAPAAKPRLQVLFSPNGGCTEAIVDALGKARTSIDIQAYSFTSAPIAEAVAKAYERGVKVRVVLDKSQRSERYTSATYLSNHQVPTWIDDKHAIAHNKIILIDGATIFTGSFNFTKAAEQKNAENLLKIEGYPELVRDYQGNFEEHLGHAEKYEGLAAKETIAPGTDGDDDGKPQQPTKPA